MARSVRAAWDAYFKSALNASSDILLWSTGKLMMLMSSSYRCPSCAMVRLSGACCVEVESSLIYAAMAAWAQILYLSTVRQSFAQVKIGTLQKVLVTVCPGKYANVYVLLLERLERTLPVNLSDSASTTSAKSDERKVTISACAQETTPPGI